ncbi:MAG: 6,7-dimethyl-8-ribityllumazine synthase [Microthrixaceae bacterium]
MGVDFKAVDSAAPQAQPSGQGRRIGIVVARWNDAITTRLLRGALAQLELRGTAADDVDVHWVPGAFEIPLMAKIMAGSGRYDAVITIGCVIRGDTAHFEYVAGPAAEGVLQAQLATDVPVIFGVLTVETRHQALVRSVIDGDYEGDNKGAEAVDTALEMAQVLEDFARAS